MRLILSRKGFDAESGGVPSPILPDGTLRPLPIPYPTGSRTFAELGGPAPRPADLVADLVPPRSARGMALGIGSTVHLDPDLDARTLDRPAGWRPTFGQTAAAQSHLAAQGVVPGDLFLFFGWFREAERGPDARWRFVRGKPGRHVVFGWLQVGELHPARPTLPAPAWLRTHEHFRDDLGPRSTAYVATDILTLDGTPVPGVPGAGIVHHLRDALVLTAPNASRSQWRLPACFAPRPDGPPLSYHRDPGRWHPDGPDHVRLHTVGKGQEFVQKCSEATLAWLHTLLAPEARPPAPPDHP